jgi:hypothetical protein
LCKGCGVLSGVAIPGMERQRTLSSSMEEADRPRRLSTTQSTTSAPPQIVNQWDGWIKYFPERQEYIYYSLESITSNQYIFFSLTCLRIHSCPVQCSHHPPYPRSRRSSIYEFCHDYLVAIGQFSTVTIFDQSTFARLTRWWLLLWCVHLRYI